MVYSHGMKSGKTGGGKRGLDGVDPLDSVFAQSSGINDVAQAAPQPVAEPASLMDSVMNSLSPKAGGGQNQQSDQRQEAMMENFQRQLAEKPKIWAPTAKLNNNDGAKGVAENRIEGENKGLDADKRMGEIKEMAGDLAKELNGGQSKDALAAQRGSPAGQIAMGGIGIGMGIMFPALGAACAAMSIAKAMTPNINPEGLGTYAKASRSGPSQFQSVSLSDRKGGSKDSAPGYIYGSGSATPQAYGQMNAAQPAQAFDKKGFGGRFDFIGERSHLAGSTLNDFSAIQLEGIAEKSVAMGQLKGQKMDADTVHEIHEARQRHGVPTNDRNIERGIAMGMSETAMQHPVMRGAHI